MSEIFVFSDRRVGSMADWQRAIDNEGFALKLSTNSVTDELTGFLSAKLGNKDAGFECDQADAATLMARYPDVDFGHAWRFARVFRGDPDLKSNIASWVGAVIFAKVTGGKIFDPRDRKLYAPEQALDPLREFERDILQVEDELKKLRERPRRVPASSSAVISVRLWKGGPR